MVVPVSRDSLRKLSLYVRPTDTYWKASSDEQVVFDVPGFYPLDIAEHLNSGHFRHFDASGLPRRRVAGALVYNYSTLCAFALAHWSCYLQSGNPRNLSNVLEVADYILRSAVPSPDERVLRVAVPPPLDAGPPSAMYHGEAISVLVRAFAATGDERYSDAAARLLPAFGRGVDANGVASRIRAHGVWFEEIAVERPRHILNGMVYALWGLRDAAIVLDSAAAADLFMEGLESLEAALPLFDAGWWSWYDAPDDRAPYLSSMMYHNLHIVQLEALGRQADRRAFVDAAARFRRYAATPWPRLRAGLELALAKAKRRLDDETA